MVGNLTKKIRNVKCPGVSPGGGDMGTLGIDSYIRDRSFVMGRGGGGFWGGHPKIFELKGGAIPKVEGRRGFLQVNVLV